MNPLSLDAINASSPYFVSLSKGEYVFQTQSGAIYNVSFDEDMEIAGCISYQFSIRRRIVTDKTFDPNVQNVILSIIYEFFAKNEDILLYTCDNSDHKESARNRLFLRWFQEADAEKQFVIKMADATIDDQHLYFAIIIPKCHPNITDICAEFDSVSAQLTNKPQ